MRTGRKPTEHKSTGTDWQRAMREAAAKYLDRLKVEGGKDLKMKRQRLDLHLVPFFGDFPLSKISGFDIERYKHQRQKEAVSVRPRGKVIVRAADKITTAKPSTIDRELAVLSHLFNKAVEWGWMDRRPAKINRFSEGKGRITYLTVDQVNRLVECAKADGNAQIYPFIVIGLETTMRKSEILSIRREDIDLQRRVIYIPKAKAGERDQPITEHLGEFLASYAAALQPGNPWLFSSPGAKGSRTVDVRKPFRRVVTAACLDPDRILSTITRRDGVGRRVDQATRWG